MTNTMTTKPASAKQIAFIERLAAERGIAFDTDGLSTRTASAAIDRLLQIKVAKPATTAPAARMEHKRGDVHMIDGQLVRIHISQSTGNPYACTAEIIQPARWDRGVLVEAGMINWSFVRGLVARCTEANRATAADAKRFGEMAGRCCFCSTKIDTPESTTAGYGPVCAAKFGLPWG